MTHHGNANAIIKSLRFGETVIENPWASDDNPQKRGVYVRTHHKRGRLNPGIWVELTDGEGHFWQIPIESVKVVKRGDA